MHNPFNFSKHCHLVHISSDAHTSPVLTVENYLMASFFRAYISAGELALVAIANVHDEANRNLASRNRIHIFICRVSLGRCDLLFSTEVHIGTLLPELITMVTSAPNVP